MATGRGVLGRRPALSNTPSSSWSGHTVAQWSLNLIWTNVTADGGMCSFELVSCKPARSFALESCRSLLADAGKGRWAMYVEGSVPPRCASRGRRLLHVGGPQLLWLRSMSRTFIASFEGGSTGHQIYSTTSSPTTYAQCCY